MESVSLVEVILIIILLGFSAFFSSSETAFTSINKIRLKSQADQGNKRAAQTLSLSKKFHSLISAILIGNNTVNIWMTSVATVLFIRLFPNYGATISTVVMTVLILTFGEITPKVLAKPKSETISKSATPFLNFLMKLLKPVIWLFDIWTKFITKLLKIEDEDVITEEELKTLVSEASEAGSLEADEHALISSAMEFDDTIIASVMRHRTEIQGVERNTSIEEIYNIFQKTNYSRLVIYEENIDHVIGVLHLKDFFRLLMEEEKKPKGKEFNFIDEVNNVILVPETVNIASLLKEMQEKHNHMAIVTDEYGGTRGLVTMEDLIEELVGEIWDEHDTIERHITQHTDQTFVVNGAMNLKRFFEHFGLEKFASEDYLANTVSGFIVEVSGHFPQKGQVVEFEHLILKVVSLEDYIIENVQVRVKHSPESKNEDPEE